MNAHVLQVSLLILMHGQISVVFATWICSLLFIVHDNNYILLRPSVKSTSYHRVRWVVKVSLFKYIFEKGFWKIHNSMTTLYHPTQPHLLSITPTTKTQHAKKSYIFLVTFFGWETLWTQMSNQQGRRNWRAVQVACVEWRSLRVVHIYTQLHLSFQLWFIKGADINR